MKTNTKTAQNTIRVNPVKGGGLLIKKPHCTPEFHNKTLNWFINNEVPFYKNKGYFIDLDFQFYNAEERKFI